ncbi:MAG TPA: alpha/beta hydrolase [Anaerolineales bacterium]|nr:alpha/beta hydrolase [Anaerolineales bacterium]
MSSQLSMPDTRYVSVNGIRLAYVEWLGERGPLICLPSVGGHKGTFSIIAQTLAPKYRVLALDLRGRGDSDKPSEGYGFAYHARDVLAFADALEVETFALVGHSFGATVGIYVASIRPKRVRAAVLIDGGCDPKEEVLEAMRPMLRRMGTIFPSMDDYLAAMRALPFFGEWNPTLESYLCEDVVTLPEGSVRSKVSSEALERDLDVHFYYSMCVHFPTVQCPTLFIRPMQGLLGDRAHILDEREAAAFVKWIPNCRRVDLPNVNHYTMVHQDDPPVIPPLKAFLDEVL